MNDARMERFLLEAIQAYAVAAGATRVHVETYRAAGILTGSRGLIVRIGEARFVLNLLRASC